jgi:hypothetical protein
VSIGDLTIGGQLTTATYYNDLQGGITNATAGAAPNFTLFNGSSLIKANKWGVGDGAQLVFQVSHAWTGAPLSPHIHFSVGTTGTGSKVKFQMDYMYCDSTDLWSTQYTDTLEVDVTAGAAIKIYRKRFLPITIANPIYSMEMKYYVQRINASSAEWTGDLWVHWFDIHEPRNTLGTPTALVVTP